MLFIIYFLCFSVAPKASTLVDPQEIAEGDDVNLMCSAEGGPRNMFTWIFNGSTVGTGPIYTITSITPAEFGKYSCFVRNAAGNDTAELTITNSG